MAEKNTCPLCGEVLESPTAIHDVATCERTELLKGRETIKTLKQSILDWKDSWFHQRDIIGELSWECHDPQHKEKQHESIGTD